MIYRGAKIATPSGICFPLMEIPPGGDSLPGAVGTGGNNLSVSRIIPRKRGRAWRFSNSCKDSMDLSSSRSFI